ncbi:MAG: virulence factor [Acidimicrobiia bacterium]|nr:virulence factor [Acidimicrobiia bacterium]MDH4308807.1 virulence factor [Acidimicrobiia bacterium]
MSRSSATPILTVISWREIPAQVTAKLGRDTARRELSARFQVAIDRAAMAAGLFGTDDYLTEWRRESRPCGPDLEAEVAAEAARLEAIFTQDLLSALWDNGGLKP